MKLKDLYKQLRRFTLRQSIILLITFLTAVVWAFLLVVIHTQYVKMSVSHFISSEERLIDSFLKSSLTNLKLHNYAEVEADMAELNFGMGEVFSGIVEAGGEYLTGDSTETFFQMLRKWTLGRQFKGKFLGEKFSYGNDGYFAFQVPIFNDLNEYLGTFFAFVSDAMFRKQAAAILMKVFAVGLLLLLVETGLLILVINSIVAPLERFIKKWPRLSNREQIEALSNGAKDPYTKDILQFSHALAMKLSKQETEIAIGRLVLQVAHDIRSPLSNIMNYIRANLDEFSEGDRKMFREVAMRSANKLNVMADDLLDYTKAGKVDKKGADIAKIISGILQEFRATADGKRITFNYSGHPSIAIFVDAHKMSRVLANLIVNSVQAIPENGAIDVDAAHDPKNQSVKIRITDNGKGIAPEHLPLIFDSSFTHGKKGGTGLGLAYCRDVVNAHGGSIEVRSKVGVGTDFEITLPSS